MKEMKKSLLFVFILLIVFFQAGKILQPTWCYGDIGDSAGYKDKMEDFYHQKEGSIDVIFLGASHCLDSFLPIELYKNYGITSYNLGSSSQFMVTSFFVLEEALHYQKPQCVVLDVSRLVGTDNKNWIGDWHYSCNYKMISSIKNWIVRYKALLATKPETDTLVEWCIPTIKFHSRWNELEEKDWNIRSLCNNYPEYLFGALGIDNSMLPWYELKLHASDINFSYSDEYVEFIYDETDKIEEEKIIGTNLPFISTSEAGYLNNIVHLCKENDITLLCVKAPTAASWDRERYSLVKRYLENIDINYIDFNYDETGITFDWNTDTLDYGLHTNYFGALKATDFIGQYLSMDKNLMDHRVDSGYEKWNEALCEYENVIGTKLSTGNEKAYKWLDELYADMEDKVILMSVKDDMSACWNEEYSKRMEKLGLTGNLGDYHRCSYIAIIDDGDVKVEKYGDEMIVHKMVFYDNENHTHKVELISKGMRQGNWCNIYIDEVDYAYHERGLNVVVYDKKVGEVVESVCIDTLWDGEFYQ